MKTFVRCVNNESIPVMRGINLLVRLVKCLPAYPHI